MATRCRRKLEESSRISGRRFAFYHAEVIAMLAIVIHNTFHGLVSVTVRVSGKGR
jgi:hypothetical protein